MPLIIAHLVFYLTISQVCRSHLQRAFLAYVEQFLSPSVLPRGYSRRERVMFLAEMLLLIATAVCVDLTVVVVSTTLF